MLEDVLRYSKHSEVEFLSCFISFQHTTQIFGWEFCKVLEMQHLPANPISPGELTTGFAATAPRIMLLMLEAMRLCPRFSQSWKPTSPCLFLFVLIQAWPISLHVFVGSSGLVKIMCTHSKSKGILSLIWGCVLQLHQHPNTGQGPLENGAEGLILPWQPRETSELFVSTCIQKTGPNKRSIAADLHHILEKRNTASINVETSTYPIWTNHDKPTVGYTTRSDLSLCSCKVHYQLVVKRGNGQSVI